MVREIDLCELFPYRVLAHEAGEEARHGVGYGILVFREYVGMRQRYAQGILEEGGNREPIGEGAGQGGLEEGLEQALEAEAPMKGHGSEGNPGLELDREKSGNGGEEEDASEPITLPIPHRS